MVHPMERFPDAAERDDLAREILALQRRFNAAAWRFAGPDVVLPDLTAQQMRVLLLVARTPGAAASAVGQQLGVAAPTASGIVERLVEKGLLERSEDPSDRRVRRLDLTEAGQATLLELDVASERMFARLVPLVRTETLTSIRDTYVSLLEAMTDAAASGTLGD